MKKERKMQMVVRKVSFAEAEEADNVYWANATEEERINELVSLRWMVWGKEGKVQKISKEVHKRSIYED
ncbi:MAG TPA: hypothetical protein VFQ86_07270 [Arachidicoccus soli]|uniref:hypothetical protein n=1 Tax=Arachidicoccus soli TaxID=2341117 RepID=UPI001969481C|nr:hypothetical protein [Arachidicoccus soli]HEU0227521.1 hypothetical protein [Arachidicoccus soli]